MSQLNHRDRNNNFNLLRLTFAVLVLLSHSFELIDGDRSRELLTSLFHTISLGELAVDGFFLLSGYLIVQSWELSPRAGKFLAKRMLRIYPGFIFASIICTFIVAPLGSTLAHYPFSFSAWQFIDNTLNFGDPLTGGIFLGQNYPLVNGVLWTISWEAKCYIAVLAIGLLGGVKNRRIWLALTAAVFAAFLFQKFGYVIGLDGKAFAREDAARFGSFFFTGGSFYLYSDKIKFEQKWLVASALLLVGLMFSGTLAELALAIFGGYMLFYFAFLPSPFLVGFLKFPDVSYGVYLYGWPIQKLILWYFPSTQPWALFAFSTCAALVCGLISWYVIEKPFLKLKSFGWKAKPV
jgi:peptidoglycan/LPS O-acetylase OafA/YrhL